MNGFMRELAERRCEDRSHHLHSRVSQALHFFSCLCFVCMYVLLFTKPVAAVLLGGLVAMSMREVGRLLFEPRRAPDAGKEAPRARRRAHELGLYAAWALATLLLVLDPTLLGLFDAPRDRQEFVDHMAKLWLGVGATGLALRGARLFLARGTQTSLVWLTKVVTDPFHGMRLYHKAPLSLLRGELYDERSKGAL
ncbi:MAG TPA: hypothetical protein VFZ61_28435 [Polyangiales bacterium]